MPEPETQLPLETEYPLLTQTPAPLVRTNPIGNYNVFAVVGFVLSFSCPLIAFIPCIVALVGIRKTREPGRSFAIAGCAISAVWALAVLYLFFGDRISDSLFAR